MKTTKTIAIAAFLPFCLAAGMWACSSSNPAGSDDDAGTAKDGSGQGDDGSIVGDDGSSGDDGSAGDDGSTTTDSGKKDSGADSGKKDAGSDAAKECGAPPTFAPTPGVGVVCPFQADAGNTATCSSAPADHCCIYPVKTGKPSTCNLIANACDDVGDAGLVADFECDEPSDCTAGVCCLVGNVLSDSCGHFGQAVQGTRCRIGGCNVGESVVCSAQSDCGSDGGTCTGLATKGKNLGACLP